MANEEITITIRAIDEATKVIESLSGSLKNLQMPVMEFGNKLPKSITVTTNAVKKQGQAWNDAKNKIGRFKMEYLGIMFAGMALQRVFSGIISSQMELWGVSSMLSDTWTVVMLPIMERLAPILYSILDVFMNLPAPVKMAIGVFVFLAAAIGGLLAIIGQVVLAVSSFSIAFPAAKATILGAIKPIIAAIGGISATFAIVAAVILALAIWIAVAFKENFMNIRRAAQDLWTWLQISFGGLVNV